MVDVDVRVRLLGPVAVEVDGQPVTGFRSHKTLALLAFLVTEQRPVARNYLATLFWPDAPLADGRGHLRRALHDLVQKLPGALWLDYYTAQFNPALFAQTDLAQLARHEGSPGALALEPALAQPGSESTLRLPATRAQQLAGSRVEPHGLPVTLSGWSVGCQHVLM